MDKTITFDLFEEKESLAFARLVGYLQLCGTVYRIEQRNTCEIIQPQITSIIIEN